MNSIKSQAGKRFPWAARLYRRGRRGFLAAKDASQRVVRLSARQSQISQYLATHENPRLQIGCGDNLLPGWLNTDAYPARPEVCLVDATKPLPFEDQTFEAVFCEHMIEHIPREKAQHLLVECARVLKPGGALRVSTVDAARILGLYGDRDQSESARLYTEHMWERYFPGDRKPAELLVINNAFYNWGHCFLYDADLLSRALEAAGLDKIKQTEFGQSEFKELKNVDSHSLGQGTRLAAFETLVLEAVRPGK